MKTATRQNIFETNSSSSHVIVISKNNKTNFDTYMWKTLTLKTVTPYISTGSYERETQELTSPEDKPSYLWTAIVLFAKNNKENPKKYLKKWKHRLIRILHLPKDTYFMFQNGKFEDDQYDFEDEAVWRDSYGSINHVEGMYDWIRKMKKSDKLVRNFIFNPSSFVHTGDDNDADLYPLVLRYISSAEETKRRRRGDDFVYCDDLEATKLLPKYFNNDYYTYAKKM